jgi:hypothetical protein
MHRNIILQCTIEWEIAMAASSKTSPSADPTMIGECAATQPVSGTLLVDQTTAVFGLGRGGFVRKDAGKNTSKI